MSYYDFVLALVRRAGDRLKVASRQAIEVSHKGIDMRDVLTATDIEIHEMLCAEIKRAYPEHRIFSEEDDNKKEAQLKGYEWVLDPIDGSANFSRHIPHFATCAALLENGIPITGAVFNPITDELFSFEKGRGAFHNNSSIQASTMTDLTHAQGILIVGHQPPLWDWGTAVYRSFLERLKKLKGLGSSALDLAFLAAGRAEVVVYGTLTARDCAAAIGIVRAAGGEVYTLDGEAVDLSAIAQPIVATANRELFEKIAPLLHRDLLPK